MPDIQLVTLLGVGFLLGLRHALNTDHLVAVSTVLADRPSLLASGAIGLCWGIGHTFMLFLVGSVALFWEIQIPEEFELIAESGVGFWLIVLGGILALNLYRERWHVHNHHHGGEPHVHRHWITESIRPFCIGMAHGLAGSAALMLMILATTTDVATGLMSILVFGLGSIVGMMVIGITISLPVIWSRSISRRLFVGVQGFASIASVLFGVWMLVKFTPSIIGH